MRDYEEVLKQARTCANRKYCDLGGNCEYYDLDVCCQGGEKDILKDAADAIEELIAAVPNWISAEERLPENEESVFVVRKFLGIKGQVPPSTYTEIAYRIGDRWFADSDEYKISRSRHRPVVLDAAPRSTEGGGVMNHDYTHCLDYRKSYCPKKCFRAELTEDLKHRLDLMWLPVSWMHLLGTAECERTVQDG